jgi:hypothetical protein
MVLLAFAEAFFAFKIHHLLKRANQQIGGAHLPFIGNRIHFKSNVLDLVFEFQKPLLQNILHAPDGGSRRLSLVGFSWDQPRLPPHAPSQFLGQQSQSDLVQPNLARNGLNRFLVLLITQANVRPNRIIRRRN